MENSYPQDSPLVTTVLTTYRRPHLVRRAIRSILNQTMPRLRLCVYDDASGDETADVVRAFAMQDPRVQYYCHADNMGAPANFEFGVQHVQTPFFSILSDDDVLLPGFYERALAEFDLYPEAMLALGITLYMGQDGTYMGGVDDGFSPGLHLPPRNLLEMSRHPQPSWTGMLFRAEVRERAGTLDTSLFSMDYDFVLRVAATCPYSVFHEPVALFTVHPNQSTAILRLHMVWPTRYTAIMRMAAIDSIPAAIRAESERILKDDLKGMLFRIALRALLLNAPRECAQTAVILRDVFHARDRYLLLTVAGKLATSSLFLRTLALAHAIWRAFLLRRVRDEIASMREYHLYCQSLAITPDNREV
jgi:glycosyltransferase involved in cell wall biosynthesis